MWCVQHVFVCHAPFQSVVYCIMEMLIAARACAQLHPDVNQLRDTTDEAAALNEAYETLQAALHISGNALLGDVFDAPEGPADELFVNPFACSASPLMWRELQV